MEWADEALILSVRPHGETAAIVEMLTRDHGRHLALVHGGRSRRNRPVLQIGNHVDATWKARLADQLGHATLTLRRGYAGECMADRLALLGLSALCAMARLLPEREAHPNLFETALFVAGFLDEADVWPALYVRWELALLKELGFGLDLESCAATGTKDDLTHVSPKTGRAVSRAAALPYADRLLPLPPFLGPARTGAVSRDDILDGLALTGHFLELRVLGPQGLALPEARRQLADLLIRA
jgi:DNA repair protein RecO (recombination protein O)